MTARRRRTESKAASPLSRERIVIGAARIVKRRGADALTMRALAKDLNVAAPSLYWHFRTREELVAEIIHEMLTGIEPAASSGPWTEVVRAHAHAIRNGVFERPELLDLMRDAPSATAELASLGLRFLLALQEAGFNEEECVRGARLLNWQVWGFILHEARLGWPRAKVDGQEQPHTYDFPMATLAGGDLDQVSHLLPHLARLDADELFQLGLEAAITSLAATKARPSTSENPS